jgi:ankyrin repeat protein
MKLRTVALAAVLSIAAFLTSHAQAAPRDETAASDLLRGAAADDVALIKSALKRGAPLEIRDSQYLFTPLGWAAWRGNTRAVRALLASGARVNARSVGGAAIPVGLRLPMVGEVTAVEPSDQTPLSLTILGNTPSTTVISLELLKHGANPNTRTARGNTPLLYSLLQSDRVVISALLAKGANPNLLGEGDAISPLTMATLRPGHESADLVRDVLAAGANPYDSFLGRPLPRLARRIKRTQSALLIEAAQKQKREKQIRESAKPAVVLTEATAMGTILQ